MKVLQLAFACHVYGGMTGYDTSYLDFRSGVSTPLDLSSAHERLQLIKWLNSWGCRQFAKAYHSKASSAIERWSTEYDSQIVSPSQDLMHLSDQEIDRTEAAFEALSDSFASERIGGANRKIKVRIGPTGAAKILFALRPKSYLPWDIPIRENLPERGQAFSYRTFLGRAKQELTELDADCSRLHINLENLPKQIGRSESTLAKLIDEYYWVTVSRKCPAPPLEEFQKWMKWL